MQSIVIKQVDKGACVVAWCLYTCKFIIQKELKYFSYDFKKTAHLGN